MSTERPAISPAGPFFVVARDLRDDLIQAVTVFPTHPQHSISILPSVTRTGYDMTLSGAGGPWT